MSALDGTVELAELLRRFPPAGEREAGACVEPGGPASEGATVTPLSPISVSWPLGRLAMSLPSSHALTTFA